MKRKLYKYQIYQASSVYTGDMIGGTTFEDFKVKSVKTLKEAKMICKKYNDNPRNDDKNLLEYCLIDDYRGN